MTAGNPSGRSPGKAPPGPAGPEGEERTGMMKKLRPLLLSMAILGILATAGRGETPHHGGVLSYRMVSPPLTLDPAQATEESALRGVNLIFEPLVDYDSDARQVTPLLAETWETNANATVWTFHLRRGVRSHGTCGGEPTANGGREVRAQDVKYSLERLVRVRAPRVHFLDMIKGYQDFVSSDVTGVNDWRGIQVLDDHTLRFDLAYPFAPFLAALPYDSYGVVPPEDAEKWGKDFGLHPVGTGPFAFKGWDSRARLSLEKNPSYWMRDAQGHPLPYVDGVDLIIEPNDLLAYEGFKKGSIDILPDCPDEVYQEAKDTLGPLGLFQQRPGMGDVYWCFNLTKEPFKGNLKLRQALNYAIDRGAISESVVKGRYCVASGVLPPSVPGYDPQLRGYSFDAERARRLMKEAGYEKGLALTVHIAADPRQRGIAEAIQAQLAPLGITLHIQESTRATHRTLVHQGETALSWNRWMADYVDPDNFLHVLFHSSNHGSRGNYSRYANPEVDRLLDEARRERDWGKRIALYRRAEQIIVDEAPWLFLYHFTTDIMYRDVVHGVKLSAMGEYKTKLTTVWKDPQ